MRYSQIRKLDISDGPGCRVGFYTQGCHFHCKGCFNSDTWDFSGGKLYTDEVKNTILDYCSPFYIKGLSILGGEPLSPENKDEILDLVKSFKEKYKDKTIWVWSGYEYEDLDNWQLEILKYCNVLVCGPFIEEEKDLTRKYAGSKNQRVIDLKTGEIIED